MFKIDSAEEEKIHKMHMDRQRAQWLRAAVTDVATACLNSGRFYTLSPDFAKQCTEFVLLLDKEVINACSNQS